MLRILISTLIFILISTYDLIDDGTRLRIIEEETRRHLQSAGNMIPKGLEPAPAVRELMTNLLLHTLVIPDLDENPKYYLRRKGID